MRMIDAHSAKEAFECTLAGDAAGLAQRVIDRMPAIDLVRCRECMMHGSCTTEDVFNCSGMDMAEAFCCAGKRKDGAE